MKRRTFLALPALLLYNRIARAYEIGGKEYSIEVSINKCRLYLYELPARKLLREYLASTAKNGLNTYPTGKGYVTRIEFNPEWHPTAYSRWYFRANKKIDLPTTVKPGDPLNYMGAFKIHLSHRTYKGDIYRIHGNNDPSLVGQRVTGGCIRLHNDEGVQLAGMISVGTEVTILS
ncbi:MAG: L,D-transpeptidase [Syntrophobacteraceae bacterium]